MALKIELVDRVIHYYELEFDFQESFIPSDRNQFRELFQIIIQIAKTKEEIRYQPFGEKSIFIQDVKIDPVSKTVEGKLRCVRKDLLPEIMNTKTDEAKGIEVEDSEGLVETTHFVIDFSKKKNKLALEYNQFGAKIIDLVLYLERIGLNKSATKKIGYRPIVKDELAELKNRINRCSEFVVKVHKDNISKIEKIDKGTFKALKAASEHFDSDYATLDLKFDYKQKTETKKATNVVLKFINKLIESKENVELFNSLWVKAEDADKNNRLEVFDLLVDKVKSLIKVEKKKQFRTIVSTDIFQKIKLEMIKKKL